MAQTILIAGDSVNQSSVQGGNDGTFLISVGPNGTKVNALFLDATGKPTLIKTPIYNDAPAFSAYQSTAVNLGTNINTQIVCQTKEYDLTNSYNATTGNFTAPINGIYLVSAAFAVASTVTTLYARVYKNGVLYKETVTGSGATQQVVCQVQLVVNDYLGFYGQQSATAQNTSPFSVDTYFQVSLIRAT